MLGETLSKVQVADNSGTDSQVEQTQIDQADANGATTQEVEQTQIDQADANGATTQEVEPENILLDYLKGTGSKITGADDNNQQTPDVTTEETLEVQEPPANDDNQEKQEPPKKDDGSLDDSIDAVNIPDKFKKPDGTVNVDALLKSYGSLEQKLGEQGNQLGQVQTLQQNINELTNIIQQQQAQQAQLEAAKNAETTKLTDEQINKMNEQFLTDYYDNPIKTMNTLVSTIAKNAIQSAIGPLTSKIDPVIKAHEETKQAERWNQQTEEIAKANPEEFEALKPVMSEVINEQADVINALPENFNKVQYIFNQAKAIKAQQEAADMAAKLAEVKTPEQMLADPEFLQKVLQNEEVSKMFSQSQAQAIRQGKPPVVISNQPTGASPATPAPDVKTIKGATPSALNYFKKVLSGGVN